MPTRRPAPSLLIGALVGAVLLTACGGPADEPAPEPAPGSRDDGSAEVTAYLGQTSGDVALGRMQVYVDNAGAEDLDPVSVTYVDPRLGGRLPGDRLRAIPGGSFRGYPVALPDRPDCATDRAGQMRSGAGRVVVDLGEETLRRRVADPVGILRRHLDLRCAALEVAAVAELAWSMPRIRGRGRAATAELVLDARPAGGAGRMVVERVNGTPVLAPAEGDVWRPGLPVAADGPRTSVSLPVRSRRCDPHAFQESGGATALRLRLRLDGRPRELVLRMRPAVAAATLDFALESCGLGS